MSKSAFGKAASLAVAVVAALALAACEGVSQGDYDKAVSERDAAVEELGKVTAEFDAYKERMKPYEEMSEAQAAAEKAKADQERKEIEEREAAEKAAAEAEAAQCKCQAVFPLRGKHFSPRLGKMVFPRCGKSFFPADGKEFFPGAVSSSSYSAA